MKESASMLEIRKIKDANSLRYIQMTNEELDEEFDEVVQKFMEKLGREVKTVSHQATR